MSPARYRRSWSAISLPPALTRAPTLGACPQARNAAWSGAMEPEAFDPSGFTGVPPAARRISLGRRVLARSIAGAAIDQDGDAGADPQGTARRALDRDQQRRCQRRHARHQRAARIPALPNHAQLAAPHLSRAVPPRLCLARGRWYSARPFESVIGPARAVSLQDRVDPF